MSGGFGIGLFELLIIAVIGIALLIVPVVVIVALMTGRRKTGPNKVNTDEAPCKACNQLAPLTAKSCPHCGAEL